MSKSSRVSDVLTRGWATYENAAAAEGRSALELLGKHAVQGGVVGGGIGGSLEAAQGGSFWDGAKQGAFNGALGLTAARGLKRATGASNYVGNGGIVRAGGNMVRSTSPNADVSKQASALLNQRQRDGMARALMNQGRK